MNSKVFYHSYTEPISLSAPNQKYFWNIFSFYFKFLPPFHHKLGYALILFSSFTMNSRLFRDLTHFCLFSTSAFPDHSAHSIAFNLEKMANLRNQYLNYCWDCPLPGLKDGFCSQVPFFRQGPAAPSAINSPFCSHSGVQTRVVSYGPCEKDFSKLYDAVK